MRVALDLSPLHVSKDGRWAFPASVRRIVEAVLLESERLDGLQVVGLRPSGPLPLGLWRQIVLPRAAAKAGAELIHCFSSSFPLRARLPVVQTVHELPWLHGVQENAGRRHRSWVDAGRRVAARTCVPSAGVARDIERELGPDRSPQTSVVHWGVGPEFTAKKDSTDAELLDALPDLPRSPFVLCPGATRPKKRVDRVLAGAGLVQLPVVVSGSGPCPNGAISTGHVPERLLPALLRRASAVAVLSDSEGFALPVLEALASGTAAVVCRDSVQAETAGPAGIEVEPDEPEDVARGLRRAIDNDPILIASGLARAGELSWARTTQQLHGLWREIL